MWIGCDLQEAALEIRKALKQIQPSGNLNSEQIAANQFAKILIMALKDVKEEMKK